MDFKTVSSDRENLVGSEPVKYYELFAASTGQVVAVPATYPVELVRGILQREVNKAKGV